MIYPAGAPLIYHAAADTPSLSWPSIVSSAITALAGLGGVLVGGWIADYRSKQERRFAWRREQLKEFYAPMQAMLAEIAAKAELEAALPSGATIHIRMLEYFSNVMPIHMRMLEQFSTHLGFAEPSTLAHYSNLVTYVNLLNRSYGELSDGELSERADNLRKLEGPLHGDIERHFMRLIDELKR